MQRRALLFVFLLGLACSKSDKHTVHGTEIWDFAPHNAFTDLIEYNGRFYCSFREGSNHGGPFSNGSFGTVRILASEDGDSWESIASIDDPDPSADLRDPKLSIMPDGRLMLLVGGTKYAGGVLVERRDRVAFTTDPEAGFTPLMEVTIDAMIMGPMTWIWRLTWEGTTGYGILYEPLGIDWDAHLVSTTDGLSYTHVTTFSVAGSMSEGTVRFRADGTMVAVARRENPLPAVIGTSALPFTAWDWVELPGYFEAPEMMFLSDGRLLAAGIVGDITELLFMDTNGTWDRRVVLTSSHDNGYPGMAVHGDDLLVSYYSSHLGKTAIFLARVPFASL